MKNAVRSAFTGKRPLLFSLFVFYFVCAALQAQDYSLRYYDESKGLSHHHSSRVLQDSTGMMWIATYNGLNRFDGYQFVTFKSEDDDEPNIASDRVRRILPANDNNLLCLIDDSVVLFNTHTCHFESVPAEDSETAKHVHIRSNPDLWKEKNQYTTLGNLRLKDILYNYEDRQGNHWLIDEHGIYVATPVPTRGVCVNTDEVRAMRQLSDGCILVSIRGAKQLAVYDSTMCLQGYVCPDGRVSRRPVSFGSQVYCIYESQDRQSLWMGCKPGGLIEVRGDKGQKTVHHYPEVRNVYDVVEDKEGNIWAATFGFGLWYRRHSATDTQPSEFTFVQGTEGMRIRRLLVTEDNTLLAATGKGLLVVRDHTMTLHQREAGRKNSLSSSALMCLSFFNGQLYIGTEGGGINRLVSKDIHAEQLEFEHITQANGLGSDIVYEFLPWSDSELLVQCNNALSILHTRKGNIINYGKSFFRFVGNKPFNLGEVQPVVLGDKLLIAPLDGLLLVNKSELRPETELVRIALSSVTLEDQTNYAVDELTHLTLSPEERSLELAFAALDYRGTTDIQYQTRFYSSKGKEKPWGAPTDVNKLLEQDLSPGEYIFEVRSTNALGQWQDNTRRLIITVTPTFWESTTGVALQIGFLLLVTIAITIQSTRIRYHRKQRQQTLSAYLDLQERYLAISNRPSVVNGKQPEPQPSLEIIAPGYTSENEKFLNALRQFMEQNIANAEMTIDDLANVTHMSRSSLNRKMHELFNLSAKDFVQTARIKHACELLRATDMAAKEVAYACGFSDPRYFSKSFKASTGSTPTEYRNNGKDKNKDKG